MDADYEILATDTVVPSRGHLTRDQDPALVPFEFGSVYDRDALFPSEQALLNEPFVVRDFRGVVVELRPIRYNPKSGRCSLDRLGRAR